MSRFAIGIILALFLGLTPMEAFCSCGHDHAEAKSHSGQTAKKGKHDHSQCKDGTCPNHKGKKGKQAESCKAGDSHCMEKSAEKQTSLRAPAPTDSLVIANDAETAVGYPLVAFLEPRDGVGARALSSVPIYLWKKSLRP